MEPQSLSENENGNDEQALIIQTSDAAVIGESLG